MRFNKIISAFGNMDKILEGVKLRYNHCISCKHFDNKGDKCAVNGTQPCCADCGCSLALKLRSLSSSCPQGKWNAVMDEDTEKAVKEQIGKNLYK